MDNDRGSYRAWKSILASLFLGICAGTLWATGHQGIVVGVCVTLGLCCADWVLSAVGELIEGELLQSEERLNRSKR